MGWRLLHPTRCRQSFNFPLNFWAMHMHLNLTGEDVGVTSIKDGHGGATEELTAGGTELNLFRG
jgi:hypothetical protein